MPQRKTLALQNRRTMLHVSRLMQTEAVKVISQGSGLGQQELGGYLRTTLPAIVQRYGNLNAVTAANYYEQVRAVSAKRAKSYKAFIPTFDPVERANTIVNYGMATFMKEGFDRVPELLSVALTRPVSAYNRETLDRNAQLDTSAKTIQRIAEPNACAFCALLAFSTTTTAEGKTIGTRTFSYAPDFHDNCHCTVEVIFEGQDPIVPDYYSDFAVEYADTTGGSTKEVLAQIRANTGRA